MTAYLCKSACLCTIASEHEISHSLHQIFEIWSSSKAWGFPTKENNICSLEPDIVGLSGMLHALIMYNSLAFRRLYDALMLQSALWLPEVLYDGSDCDYVAWL